MELCMRRSMKKGFTLIELLIVVVIIGILAAVAIPKFANTKQRASRASGLADLRNLATAQEGYFADSSRYGVTVDTLTFLNFRSSNGNRNLTILAAPGGWNATIVVPGPQTCGIFVGLVPGRPGGMAVTVNEGVPTCW